MVCTHSNRPPTHCRRPATSKPPPESVPGHGPASLRGIARFRGAAPGSRVHRPGPREPSRAHQASVPSGPHLPARSCPTPLATHPPSERAPPESTPDPAAAERRSRRCILQPCPSPVDRLGTKSIITTYSDNLKTSSRCRLPAGAGRTIRASREAGRKASRSVLRRATRPCQSWRQQTPRLFRRYVGGNGVGELRSDGNAGQSRPSF